MQLVSFIHSGNGQRPRGKSIPRLAWLVMASLTVTGLLSAAALAQEQQPDQRPALSNPTDLFGRETAQSVFVRDSAVAVEKFALAGRMERLKEWDKAADVYQELLRNFADRVVPWKLDADKNVIQYVSIAPAVQEQIARWPQAGLDVYRGRFGGEASAALDAAQDDIPQLHRVVSLYFVTDAARRAAVRMIDLYIERGEFDAAAWTGDRLLDWHPALGEQRPSILYRTGLAYHLAGNDDRATVRLNELKEKFPQAQATVRGADVILADSLAQEIAGGAVKLGAESAESWRMAFGSADRSRIISSSSFGGARLFGINLPKPVLRNGPLQQRQELEAYNKRDMSAGLMTGIMPVVDRGEMFFQDNSRIFAVSLESGLPLPGWADTYDGDRNGQYVTNGWPSPRSHQTSVTLTDDSVLAIMGQPDIISMTYTGTIGLRDTRLVCLDRRSGRERWVARSRQFPDEAANLRTLDLIGSPLVVGQTVYVQARGGKGMQFEDSYVVAFDLQSGKFEWACYVASANSSPEFWDGSDVGALFGNSSSHLAYSSGRIYALTNLGAVAAIDAYDGTIAWLDLYPRDVAATNRFQAGFRGFRVNRQVNSTPAIKPWTSNPVIVSQGKVFVLPSDGSNLHIYDARDGAEVKRIALSAFEDANTMLGVLDEKLILNSDRQVFAINWPDYQPPPKKSRDENLVWATGPLQRPGQPDDSIRGRGFVTADSVIIPTAWQLYRISMRNGKTVQTYPPGRATAWGDDEGPGNILVTQDRLIIAGPTADGSAMRVNVYTDLALAMSKLDAEVAASPQDPSIRLRYAEIMFVAGKLDAAVARLDEAVSLNSSQNAAQSGGTRDRIFNTALTFAEKLAKENRADTAPIMASLYDRASAAAVSPSQKVHYLLSRANYAKQTGQAELELKLYQQILADAELRRVPVASADGDASPASEMARNAVDSVIRRAGATVYAPYEAAAADLLQSASRVSNPEQLQAIADTYPNSTVAPRALLAAADVYEAANNPSGATQVLRQAYFRYPARSDSPRILEAMARNYLKMPRRADVAIARLNQATDPRTGASPQLSRPLQLPNGQQLQNMTMAEAARQLKQFSAQLQDRDLPDIGLGKPIRGRGRQVSAFAAETPASVISGVTKLLVPSPEAARNDRVITFAAGSGVRVFAIGQTRPLFSAPGTTQPPVAAAWCGNDLLVWSENELVYINESGQTLWTSGLKAMPQMEVVVAQPAETTGGGGAAGQGGAAAVNAPGEEIVFGNNVRVLVANGQQIIRGPNGIQIINVGAAPVEVPQPPKPGTEQIVQVRPLSDRVIVGTSDGRVMALSFDGGKPVWQTRIGDRAATHLLATDDFVVTRYSESAVSAQLCVFDTATGQVISRRSFGVDAGSAMIPVNLALAPDGMLVFLLPNQICGKDLFEPGGLDKLTYPNRATGMGEPAPVFQGATDPMDLQIAGDRVIVVANDSAGGSMIRTYSLRTGTISLFNRSDTLMRMDAITSSARFLIRAVGSHVYVVNQKDMRGFDLDNGTGWPPSPIGIKTSVNVRDLIITQTHAVVIAEPGNARPPRGVAEPPAPFLKLLPFSRAVVGAKGAESGLLEFDESVTDTSGIINWQAVDGGMYYCDSAQRLHFLKGAAAK